MGNFSLHIIILVARPGLGKRAAETGTKGIETWGHQGVLSWFSAPGARRGHSEAAEPQKAASLLALGTQVAPELLSPVSSLRIADPPLVFSALLNKKTLKSCFKKKSTCTARTPHSFPLSLRQRLGCRFVLRWSNFPSPARTPALLPSARGSPQGCCFLPHHPARAFAFAWCALSCVMALKEPPNPSPSSKAGALKSHRMALLALLLSLLQHFLWCLGPFYRFRALKAPEVCSWFGERGPSPCVDPNWGELVRPRS